MGDRTLPRVLIADDEPPSRRMMAGYAERHPGLGAVEAVGSGDAAVEAIERSSPDIVLLDVEMPGLDGFGVLAEVGRRGLDGPKIVFVTAYERYAVRAFDIHAIDYLLKPVSYERFRVAIDRCLARPAGGTADQGAEPATPPLDAEAGARPNNAEPERGQRAGDEGVGRRQARVQELLEDALHLPPQRLLVRQRGRITPVPVDEVDWIESSGDYVVVHVGPDEHMLERSLAEMAELLERRGFARVHRGAIVNLSRIKELRPLGSGRYELVLHDDKTLIVSRSFSHQFKGDLI